MSAPDSSSAAVARVNSPRWATTLRVGRLRAHGVGSRVDLRAAEVGGAVQDLPVQVGLIDQVVVDDGDRADARGGQDRHDRAAQTARADDDGVRAASRAARRRRSRAGSSDAHSARRRIGRSWPFRDSSTDSTARLRTAGAATVQPCPTGADRAHLLLSAVGAARRGVRPSCVRGWRPGAVRRPRRRPSSSAPFGDGADGQPVEVQILSFPHQAGARRLHRPTRGARRRLGERDRVVARTEFFPVRRRQSK